MSLEKHEEAIPTPVEKEGENPSNHEEDSSQRVRKAAAGTNKILSAPVKMGKKFAQDSKEAVARAVSKGKAKATTEKVTSVVKSAAESAHLSVPSHKPAPDLVDEGDSVLDKEQKSTLEIGGAETVPSPEKVSQKSTRKSLKMVNVGPILGFFLRDNVILVVVALAVATKLTMNDWESIKQENELPLQVSLAWMAVTFCLGRMSGARYIKKAPAAPLPTPEAVPGTIAPEEVVVPPKSKHRIMERFAKNFRVKPRFSGEEEKRAPSKTKKFWTTLTHRGGGSSVTAPAQSQVSNQLMNQLLQNPRYRRLRRKGAEEQTPQEVAVKEEEGEESLGTFDLSAVTADSLAGDVIDPLWTLRGMDVFLPEGDDMAQDSMGTHPSLLAAGLRKKPMVLVNIMMSWANVVLYFDLPSWFNDWHSIEEKEDDPDDVKALKRFLVGDDDYRNLRLRMLPCVVEASRLVTMLAPPKKEMPIVTPLLPVAWIKHHKQGKDQAMLEVELDCMSNKAMRGMCNIVKRNMTTTVIDLAVMVSKPDVQEEDEPSACLGMWRFDRVSVDDCPYLPARVTETDDMRRASMIMNIPEEKMIAIAQEA